ncbi:hypothetical protein E2C01_081586 [Portunus trituberculatus]|uniref:Uncharacterized protein n=1 Tax=Portunus trituberculatus TaxID=210409 RepID=A0A5B7IQ59_PORTR|nr:hypothetical protein [Portunus trituberculatus]
MKSWWWCCTGRSSVTVPSASPWRAAQTMKQRRLR